MLAGLLRAAATTVVLSVCALAVGTASARAQSAWGRQVSESGPVGPVLISTLGSEFWTPLPGSVPYRLGAVGMAAGPPLEIVQGHRGDDVLFTLPPTFRRAAPPSGR